MSDTPNLVYVLGDGDHIRVNVERHLLAGDTEKLRRLSLSLVRAVEKLKEVAASELSADVAMAGGDDILLIIPGSEYREEVLLSLMAVFQESCGCTLSFGVGRTIEAAFLALRKAKALGGARVLSEEVEGNTQSARGQKHA